jgi:hypothetical protein
MFPEAVKLLASPGWTATYTVGIVSDQSSSPSLSGSNSCTGVAGMTVEIACL